MGILDEAKSLVNGERRETYDHPLPNHQRIADYLDTYFHHIGYARPDKHLTPQNCAIAQIFVKLAREEFSHKRDNLVDIAGYAEVTDIIYGAQQHEEDTHGS